MRIKSIHMQGFLVTDDRTLELPERGIVMVSGPNGAGKTRGIHAVSYAFWAQLLKGPKSGAWTEKGKRSLRVETYDGLWIERSPGTCRWSNDGAKSEKWPTPSKATAALAKVLPLTYEVWKRSCVVSSSGTDLFSLDGDAGRKRLLEALVRVHGFDEAASLCRKDLRKIEDSRHALTTKEARATTAIESAQSTIVQARAAIAEIVVPPASDGENDPDKLETLADEATAEADRLRAKVRTAATAAGEAVAEANAARKKLELLAGGACPTCEQGIPKSLKTTLSKQAKKAGAKAIAAKKKASTEADTIEAQAAEVDEEADSLITLARKIQNAEATRRRAEADKSRWETAATKAEITAAKAKAALENVRASMEKTAQEVGVLQAVENVLGLRGARAHMLSGAVSAVSGAAARHLSLLYGGRIRGLRLASHTMLKSGDVSDKVLLEVEDEIGRWRPYVSASQGEARRVDVAIVLALADLASAAAGAGNATLFADEVFDALDPEGIQGVSALLAEASRDRCIVLITHNPEVANAIEADVRIQMKRG